MSSRRTQLKKAVVLIAVAAAFPAGAVVFKAMWWLCAWISHCFDRIVPLPPP